MARIIIESLKRLYADGRITKEQVLDRVDKGTITWEDYEVIVNEKSEG